MKAIHWNAKLIVQPNNLTTPEGSEVSDQRSGDFVAIAIGFPASRDLARAGVPRSFAPAGSPASFGGDAVEHGTEGITWDYKTIQSNFFLNKLSTIGDMKKYGIYMYFIHHSKLFTSKRSSGISILDTKIKDAFSYKDETLLLPV